MCQYWVGPGPYSLRNRARPGAHPPGAGPPRSTVCATPSRGGHRRGTAREPPRYRRTIAGSASLSPGTIFVASVTLMAGCTDVPGGGPGRGRDRPGADRVLARPGKVAVAVEAVTLGPIDHGVPARPGPRPRAVVRARASAATIAIVEGTHRTRSSLPGGAERERLSPANAGPQPITTRSGPPSG